MRGLSFKVCQRRGVVGHVCKYKPLLVIIFTKDLVLTQIEAITDAKSVAKYVKLKKVINKTVFLSQERHCHLTH